MNNFTPRAQQVLALARKEADRSLVDELFILTQPAHLQKQHSEKLGAEERDLLRADMVRERLRSVSRPVARLTAIPGTGLDKSAE